MHIAYQNIFHGKISYPTDALFYTLTNNVGVKNEVRVKRAMTEG